jgi:tRNA-dihydrouridine synthase B
MKLGKLQVDNFLVLAPMAGISDYPFRQIAREKGCDLAFTGLMNAEGLLRKRGAYLRIEKDDHPLSVQLFGSDPEVLAEAAQWAAGIGADTVDVNMGCPASQVIGIGAGVDLMRSPEKVDRILLQVRKALEIPLSIKIRSGWDGNHINAVDISKMAENCGVDAIIIHPRTKVQEFRGRADWTLIREVKKSVSIPVIGNGDVTTSSVAIKMMEETGCDGVMIGRGSLGNPWIFNQLGVMPFPTLEERQRVMTLHFSFLESYYGGEEAIKKIKRHGAWYTKGLPASASFRKKLFILKEKEAYLGTLASYFEFIKRRNPCQSFPLAQNGSAIG